MVSNYVFASECYVGDTLTDVLGNIFKVVVIGSDIKFFQNIKNEKITQAIATKNISKGVI